MKKFLVFSALVVFVSSAYSSTEPARVPNKHFPITANEVYCPMGKSGELISLMELSQISVKDFQKFSGRKMTLIQKVHFKFGQRQLKKHINPDGSFNSAKYGKYFAAGALFTGISWSGLALGVFLSVIGVLIAYLIKTGDRRSRIRWAWIGAIISFVVVGAILII